MENNRIVKTFLELVAIDSESNNEGPFQAYLKERCEALGMIVYEDDTAKQTGLGAGNLICRLEGSAKLPPLMFCCHSDTVVPGVGIQPQIKNEIIYSDGETILAADDKAGNGEVRQHGGERRAA